LAAIRAKEPGGRLTKCTLRQFIVEESKALRISTPQNASIAWIDRLPKHESAQSLRRRALSSNLPG
jgi:hypothetical protein